jgi:hypothetical protein
MLPKIGPDRKENIASMMYNTPISLTVNLWYVWYSVNKYGLFAHVAALVKIYAVKYFLRSVL